MFCKKLIYFEARFLMILVFLDKKIKYSTSIRIRYLIKANSEKYFDTSSSLSLFRPSRIQIAFNFCSLSFFMLLQKLRTVILSGALRSEESLNSTGSFSRRYVGIRMTPACNYLSNKVFKLIYFYRFFYFHGNSFSETDRMPIMI